MKTHHYEYNLFHNPVKFPLFAPLKNFEFDRNKVAAEMEAITDDLHHVAIRTDEHGISEFTTDDNFKVAPERVRLQTYRSDGQQVIEGDYGSYRVANLTYLSEHSKSRYQQSFKSREGKRLLYLYEYPRAWDWVPGLEIPCIRQIVSNFPFEFVQMVRSVILLPPAIGPIHVDSPKAPAKRYLQNGFASITLNVAGGGAELLFQAEGGVRSIDQSIYAWHFDSSVPHGTTEVRQPRFQLRIYGKLQSDVSYLDLMDLKRAIWS